MNSPSRPVTSQLIFYVCLLCTFLFACSQNNHVAQVMPLDGKVLYKNEEGKRRFTNLFSGMHTYPYTCTENCYPKTENILCEQPMEECQYVGANPNIDLGIGIDLRWLGHASFEIVTSEGQRLLIDPVSKQFDWPVDWVFNLAGGFFRHEPKWLKDFEMQELDAVLYSHIHYDHFSKSDIQKMGSKPIYFTPLGFAKHFPQNDYSIKEMSWFAQSKVENINIHFVPANHFSSRIQVPYLYEDDDMTLWGGWVIEIAGKRIFYAGDTGYSPHFKEIQQNIGDMDVCLIPIASYYHPKAGKWYRHVHTNPEDAFAAAQDLNCKVMIPWGYGNHSWKMGDHTSHSALFRLLNVQNILQPSTQLIILNEGNKISL